MKRCLAVGVMLVLAASAVSAQEPYSEGLLGTFGLEMEEIEQIQEIQRETSAELRVRRAELEVRKAELARLLVDDDPRTRAIERNLRETAEIEVQIRMLEIERELAIREVIGTDRWMRIAGAVRARRLAGSQGELGEQLQDRLRLLELAIEEGQERVRRAVEGREEIVGDEDIRRQFDLLREEYRELKELIRERL